MKKTTKVYLFLSQIVFLLLLPTLFQLTSYLHPLVIGVVWFCYTLLVLYVVCVIQHEKIVVSRRSLHMIAFLYLSGLIVLLFFRPANQEYGSINLVPFETILYYLSGEVNFLIAFYNLAANIGLFIPFGLYFCYIKIKPNLNSLFMVAICSICVIEGLQYLTKRGSLDIDDLILNVFGVLVGFFIYPLIQKVFVLKND
ncbi:MAG: VanZ family protein [Anaerobacillus sp.]|uniref:VanZ family protein n=1 Tax=Anaerobacillus sp. TaxID=1872506 RepID=UPI003919AC17